MIKNPTIGRVRFDECEIEAAFESPYPASLVGKGNVPLLCVCARCYKYSVDTSAAELHYVGNTNNTIAGKLLLSSLLTVLAHLQPDYGSISSWI